MQNKQRAFIILTPGFPSSESDTTCLPMQQQLVRVISKMYPETEIIILSFQYPYYEREYKWFGVTVFSFNGRNRGGIPKLILRQKLNAVLKKISKEKKIIGLLSFWLNECALIGKRFGERHSIPHYCWLLGQDAKKENPYPGKLSVKGNELIALSDFLKGEFEKNHGICPFAVIPPGIEKKINGVGKRNIDLLAAGSLIPLKQFDIFVWVVNEVKKQWPQVNAVIIGEGPEKNKLQKLIAQLDLHNNLSLAGELPHNEVLQLMSTAKILLHPSSYEGFSGVCMEALNAGAHLISFCKPMKQEICQWHIVNNNEELKQKTLELLSQKDLKFCDLTSFPIETTAQKIMALYDSEK